MFVCVARLTLQIPESGSLKNKRQVLRRVTDRVKARFNVSVGEVADQELWQKATVGVSLVAPDKRSAEEGMDRILHFIEELYIAPIISREREILSFGDELFGDAQRVPGTDFQIDNGQRSLAEAEGMADWDTRHTAAPPATASKGTDTGRAPQRAGELNLEEVRAKARSLRNPREWEKK